MSSRRRDQYKKLYGKHILIVDDYLALGKMLSQLLKEYDHASYVTSGKQALQEIDRELPDIVLLDITLPDINGLDLARALRQNPKTKSIPILAMSGKPAERSSSLAAGCDDFILKPFAMRTLLNRLSRVL
jgi:putative two-component system response regulator